MKRYIRSSKTDETIFEDENFMLVSESGVGMNDTPWEGLRVITKEGSIAEKHVIEIRLNSRGFADFNGEPVKYKYKGAYIAHGMRSTTDTLDDIREYIEALEDAVDFAEAVNEYIPEYNKG